MSNSLSNHAFIIKFVHFTVERAASSLSEFRNLTRVPFTLKRIKHVRMYNIKYVRKLFPFAVGLRQSVIDFQQCN